MYETSISNVLCTANVSVIGMQAKWIGTDSYIIITMIYPWLPEECERTDKGINK